MNVYFCREYDDDCGLMIIARNNGVAKSIFNGEIGCSYIDVRCRTLKKNIGDYREGVIQTDDEITLDSLGLKYDHFRTEDYI